MEKIRRKKFEQYQDMIARLYPELRRKNDDGTGKNILSRTVTFQVTDNCNLACKYCYQINKSTRKMSFETAKKFIDLLLSGEKGFADYVSPEFSPAIIIEFIGGEPFMEIELIDQICDYFFREAIRLEHPWATMHCFSICSNGILYRDPKVQKFLEKHHNNLSFSVTIDGNKELHDSCRVFHDGSPSYDIAIDAAIDWMKRGYDMGSKLTIAPGNINYLYDAIIHMINLNYDEIHANCVYEEGWTLEHATKFYYELKQIADYLMENNLESEIELSLFEEHFFTPKLIDDLQNWCFRAGTMISTPNGAKPIEDLVIGEKVFTSNGEVHEIENLMCHESYDNYTIKASGMFKTFTTGDHPYLCKRFSHIGNKGKYKYHKPDFIKVKDISKGDKIALSIYEFGTEEIDPTIAYIVGRYIGNGWWGTETGYDIGCTADEYDEIETKLREANIEFSYNRSSSYCQFHIYRINRELDSILCQCSTKTREKKLPNNIFQWKQESVEALISGLFSVSGVYNEGYQIAKISTESFILASQLLEVIRSLGYFPTCSSVEDDDRDKYTMREIYFKVDKSSRFMEYDEEYGVVWATVHSVEEYEDPYIVYNLTVSDNHTFIANGALVHNCGGTGAMLSVDPDGYLYPCIRYMESSLGCQRPPLRIGHVDIGIAQTEEHCNIVKELNAIDRRTESTDECFYCPIADGCSWCSAYNYQINGTVNSRVTFICIMHKARAIANAYYWAKVYEKYGETKKYRCYVPDDWALEIIPEEEWNMILALPSLSHITDPEVIRGEQIPNYKQHHQEPQIGNETEVNEE